jgi:hypothetical protein
MRQAALSKTPGITLLLDTEYIQKMASEILQDLSGVLELYGPFFESICFEISNVQDIKGIAEAVLANVGTLPINPIR